MERVGAAGNGRRMDADADGRFGRGATVGTACSRSLAVSVPALTTPLIIVGGKIFGWFTATESACIAVLYAGALSLFSYRELTSAA